MHPEVWFCGRSAPGPFGLMVTHVGADNGVGVTVDDGAAVSVLIGLAVGVVGVTLAVTGVGVGVGAAVTTTLTRSCAAIPCPSYAVRAN